jgi:4-hydroxy-tetrahydrodipicolinate synthase
LPKTDRDAAQMLISRTKAIIEAKVIMGAGSNSTVTAVEMSKMVEKVGVDAILSVIPYYNKPNARGQKEHFRLIAQAVDTLIIIYNIPGRTGVNMTPDTITSLAKEFDNIVAVKQSNPDMDQITEIASNAPEGFTIYSGDDSLTLQMLSLGVYGVISVASHFIGKEIKEMITKFKSGDVKGAQAIQYKCYPLFKNLFLTTSPGPLKACLSKWGIISENMRPPMIQITAEEREKVYKVLESYQKLSV